MQQRFPAFYLQICLSFQHIPVGLTFSQPWSLSSGIKNTMHRRNLVKTASAVPSSSRKEARTADSLSPELKNSIVKALTTVRSGGDFCAGGRVPLPIPGLAIDGVGDISLPLLPEHATAIKQLVSQAPCARKTETELDTSVCSALQIDASKAAFLNPEWNQAVQDLARLACHTMGLAVHNVRAELYNLLLYDADGKIHPDTGKADGKFGTLVVQFPSKHQGGDFIVRHRELERVFKTEVDDFSSQYGYHYVAHYADCEHEVRPVTDGNRLVAVYSLCWKGKDGIPSAPNMAPVLELAEHLPKIGNKTLGLLMKHEYTEYALTRYGLRALSGIDRALAGTFIAASNVMKEHNGSDELIFYFVRLNRLWDRWGVQDISDCIRKPPAIDYDSMKKLDPNSGSTMKSSEVDLLRGMKVFKDILNYQELRGGVINTYGIEELKGAEHVNGYFQNYGGEVEVDSWIEDRRSRGELHDKKKWFEDSDHGWWNHAIEIRKDKTEFTGYLLFFHRKNGDRAN